MIIPEKTAVNTTIFDKNNWQIMKPAKTKFYIITLMGAWVSHGFSRKSF